MQPPAGQGQVAGLVRPVRPRQHALDLPDQMRPDAPPVAFLVETFQALMANAGDRLRSVTLHLAGGRGDDTPADASAEVEVAMKAWLAVAKEDKLPIPKPRLRPAIYAAEQGVLQAQRAPRRRE